MDTFGRSLPYIILWLIFLWVSYKIICAKARNARKLGCADLFRTSNQYQCNNILKILLRIRFAKMRFFNEMHRICKTSCSKNELLKNKWLSGAVKNIIINAKNVHIQANRCISTFFRRFVFENDANFLVSYYPPTHYVFLMCTTHEKWVWYEWEYDRIWYEWVTLIWMKQIIAANGKMVVRHVKWIFLELFSDHNSQHWSKNLNYSWVGIRIEIFHIRIRNSVQIRATNGMKRGRLYQGCAHIKILKTHNA